MILVSQLLSSLSDANLHLIIFIHSISTDSKKDIQNELRKLKFYNNRDSHWLVIRNKNTTRDSIVSNFTTISCSDDLNSNWKWTVKYKVMFALSLSSLLKNIKKISLRKENSFVLNMHNEIVRYYHYYPLLSQEHLERDLSCWHGDIFNV